MAKMNDSDGKDECSEDTGDWKWRQKTNDDEGGYTW